MQKATALALTIALVGLIIAVFIPSSPAVKLSPGTPSTTSLYVNNDVIFKNVNLTIRGTEAIPIDFLRFIIYSHTTNNPIASVNFTLNGTILIQNPTGRFTILTLSNTTGLPYNTTWGYGYDEPNGPSTNYSYGYGYGPSGATDLILLYNITYKAQTTGTFYAKLFVNATTYTYTSEESTRFTVQSSYTPPPGGGGGDEPELNDPPVAHAGGPYKGTVDVPVTFDASQSTDDVGVVGYRWDWENDGLYDTEWLTTITATHTYTITGVFTVRLQVKDAENLTDSGTSIVTINGDNIYAPVADADGPYRAMTYQPIRFDGSGSYGINGSIVNYTWNFGDSTTGYGQTPTHTYENPGTFLVVLTVMDSNNLSSIDSTTARIVLDANRNNISDIMEETIGVPITESDIQEITVNGEIYYLVDINQDAIPDLLYDPTTNTKTTVGRQDGKPLLDINGDGQWDFIYDPVLGTATPYKSSEQPFDFPWIIVAIFAISIIVLVALVWMYRTGRI